MQKLFYRDLQVGIVGGGQLGRMLIQAGIEVNLPIHVLDPDAQAPCCHLAHSFQQGKLTDYDTVYNFGSDLDLITIEIENINVDALRQLKTDGKQVYPDPEVIAMIQDKRAQKQFFQQEGIPTAPFHLIEGREDLHKLSDFLPGVFKLATAGYDGRGVQVLKTPDQIEGAFDAPGLLESFVDFEKEIAVIAARNVSGEISIFPVVEMVFHPEENLVEYLFSPAHLSPTQHEEAANLARIIVEKIEMVGVLAIEMFVTKSGELLINEMAPRPHNSGHHTIRANATSQYEQHLRAILDLPLGDTKLLKPAAMINLLGEPGHSGPVRYEGLNEIMAVSGVYPHLYGKAMTRPFRKMGHVTILDDDLEQLREKADFVKQTLKAVT